MLFLDLAGLTLLFWKTAAESLLGADGRAKDKEGLEPQLNWEEPPSPDKWPRGTGYPERAGNLKNKVVPKTEGLSQPHSDQAICRVF